MLYLVLMYYNLKLMKKNLSVVSIFALIAALVLISCDDSGVNHLSHKRGIISFSQKNLKRLDPALDGIYELWLQLDSAGMPSWYSLGKFNIGFDGYSMVDFNEQPVTFKYNGDTSLLSRASVTLVSIEDTGTNFNPSSFRLISGNLSVNEDSIWGSLNMGGDLSLGAAGRELFNGKPGKYTIQTPTTGSGAPECYKGVWISSITGDTAGLPTNVSLTPGKGWIYEAWVVDTASFSYPVYYSMGRFYSTDNADGDGAGPCAGPNPGYNKPGQDWIQPGCPVGKPEIINLTAGYYRVMVSLEPETEPNANAYNTPFPYTIYSTYIGTTLGCKVPYYLYNIPWQDRKFPEGKLYITN